LDGEIGRVRHRDVAQARDVGASDRPSVTSAPGRDECGQWFCRAPIDRSSFGKSPTSLGRRAIKS